MEFNGMSLVLYEIVSILFQITAVVLNGAIICTLTKKSLFRCPSNKFVFSLCLSQLLLSIISFLISVTQSFLTSPNRSRGTFLRSMSSIDSTPPVIIPNDPGNTHHHSSSLNGVSGEILQNSGRSSYILCHFQLYAAFTVAVGACLTIGLISIDRYITISVPMKYKSIVTPGRCTLAITLCWLVSALITLLPPLFIFGNETFLHGPIAIPKGALGLYFAIVFSIVTILVLSVMIRCYNRIFQIAKEKCQKVQIGHFTSPVSSISSDWPASAYSSQHDRHRIILAPTALSEPSSPFHKSERLTSNSLLQYVLLANLGKQVISTADPQRIRDPFGLNSVTGMDEDVGGRREDLGKTPFTVVTVPSSPRTSCRSGTARNRAPNGPKTASALLRQGTRTGFRKWKTFLQHNYNSPRKTVSTIVTLIGSLALTQLPLTVALYTTSLSPTVFYFMFKILLGLSAISSPILYGFLNRTIRVYLWKFLRIRRRYSAKGFSFIGSKTFDSRKASISSGSGQYFPKGDQRDSQVEIDSREILRPNNNNNDGEILLPLVTLEVQVAGDKELLRNGRIRKKSQEMDDFPSSKEQNKYKLLQEQSTKETVEVYLDPQIRNPLCEDMVMATVEEEDEKSDNSELSSSFPRKPSQDSGADVSFSEDEEEVRQVSTNKNAASDATSSISESTMRARGCSPRSPLYSSSDNNKVEDRSERMRVVLAVALGEGCQYADEGDEDEFSCDEFSEPDDLFDFDEDDEHFERMKEIIKKKFSLTEEDLQSIRSLDSFELDEDPAGIGMEEAIEV